MQNDAFQEGEDRSHVLGPEQEPSDAGEMEHHDAEDEYLSDPATPTGTPLAEPPLLADISRDPYLQGVKLIAEAWDCDGLVQVGAFPHFGGRWAEWNGQFRDAVRQFVKGTDGPWAGKFASALCGSPELFGRAEADPDDWWGTHAGARWRGGRGPRGGAERVEGGGGGGGGGGGRAR